MNDLRARLNALQAALAGIGVDLAAGTDPGATAAQIAAAEQAMGVKFPEEVRTWFEWHNGPTGGGLNVVRPLETSVATGWYLISLDQAVLHYHTDRRVAVDVADGDEAESECFFGSQMIPLLIRVGSGTVVAYGADHPNAGGITAVYFDSPGPHPPEFESLTDMVEFILEAIADGMITVNQESQGLEHPPYDQLPDRYRHSALFS